MALFKPHTWGLVKVWRDIENYLDFKRVIDAEVNDPHSKFNNWNLKHNYFYTIYFTMDIDETEAQLPEKIKRLRIIESIAPFFRYLDEELGFAGSLSPEFNQFIDDEGNETLTYLIAMRFVFEKLSLRWVLKWGIIGSTLAYFIHKYELISAVKTWFQTLT